MNPMKIAELSRRLPPRTVMTLFTGAVVAVGFLVVFVIPEFREAGRLREAIAGIKADIDIQTRLAPVRAKLRKDASVLPKSGELPTIEPMPLSDVGRLTELLDELAKPAGVRLAAVTPEANSAGKNGMLAVDLRLLGSLGAMHEFLLGLTRFPPLVSIESATTMVGQDGRELALKCWLAVR
jgi:hypothetical protein